MGRKKFPTAAEVSFIREVSNFCQEKYGFPVPQVFSAAAKYQKELYVVMVCRKYKFWAQETPVKYFYVYFGPNKERAEKIAGFYRRKDFDVYIRDKCYHFSSAPEFPIVLTPDFFKGDYITKIGTLIHESFHQYVHKNDVGLNNYCQYMTFAELIDEESLASILGYAGVLDYLTEIKQEPRLAEQAKQRLRYLGQYHSWYSEPYKRLNDVYKSDNNWQKRKERKELLDRMSGGNAELLHYYSYFSTPQMAGYLKLLPYKNGRIELASLVKTFSLKYWSKHLGTSTKGGINEKE